MAGVEVDMFTGTSTSLSLSEQENRTHEYRNDLWGYAVHTQSDTCISFINTFYHQVELEPFLGFRMLNSVNLLRHLNSHNHQLTWLRLEEINFLAAWIEMTGSKFWATKADFISSECSEKFSLSSNLVRSSVNFSTFCHQEWSSPSLGSWNFSGVEAVLAQIRRFVTLNCYLRKPLLDSVHL